MQSYRFLKLKIIMQRLVTVMTQFDLEVMSMFFLSATNTFWSLYCQGELVAHLIWFQFNGLLSYFRAYCIFMHEHIFIVSWYAACATADQLHYFMHSKWIEKNSKQHMITLRQEIFAVL